MKNNFTLRNKFKLPDDWQISKLTGLSNLITDGTHLTPNYIESGIPFLRVTDIQSFKIELANVKYISLEEHEILIKRCRPEKGDILLSKNGSVGIPIIVNWDWPFSIFVSLALIKLKNELLHNVYLNYLFKSELIHWQILSRSKQGTVTNLHLEEIRELEIPTPILPEQTKIADILLTTDNVIEKTEAAIEKFKAIKQGMIHDLFTRGIDIETGKTRPRYEAAPDLYKESDLGLIPKDWSVDSLENITSYVDYRGKTPPKSDSGIFLITAKNIRDGIIDYETSKEFILESSYENAMSRGKPMIGDVIITTEAPLGNVAQIDNDKVALAQRIIKYRAKDDIIINDFLKLSLTSNYFQKLLYINSTGSTVQGIKGSKMRTLPILIPNIDEQLLISEMVKKIEGTILSEKHYLNKLLCIKSGLIQDLLTGKKRVKVEK